MLLNEVGHFPQQVAPLRAAHGAPGAVVEGGAGGGDGGVYVGGVRQGDFAQRLAGGRIDGEEGLAAAGGGPFVVDEQFMRAALEEGNGARLQGNGGKGDGGHGNSW